MGSLQRHRSCRVAWLTAKTSTVNCQTHLGLGTHARGTWQVTFVGLSSTKLEPQTDGFALPSPQRHTCFCPDSRGLPPKAQHAVALAALALQPRATTKFQCHKGRNFAAPGRPLCLSGASTCVSRMQYQNCQLNTPKGGMKSSLAHNVWICWCCKRMMCFWHYWKMCFAGEC